MPKYRVSVFPMAQIYLIDAEDEELAIQQAEEYVMEETNYDIFKWADYETEEIK